VTTTTELEPVVLKSARFGVKQSGGMDYLPLTRIYTSPEDPSLFKLERRQFIGQPGISGMLKPSGSLDVVLREHDDTPAVSLALDYDSLVATLEERRDGTWEVLTLHVPSQLTGDRRINLHADAMVWLFEGLPAKERDINVRRS